MNAFHWKTFQADLARVYMMMPCDSRTPNESARCKQHENDMTEVSHW